MALPRHNPNQRRPVRDLRATAATIGTQSRDKLSQTGTHRPADCSAVTAHLDARIAEMQRRAAAGEDLFQDQFDFEGVGGLPAPACDSLSDVDDADDFSDEL